MYTSSSSSSSITRRARKLPPNSVPLSRFNRRGAGRLDCGKKYTVLSEPRLPIFSPASPPPLSPFSLFLAIERGEALVFRRDAKFRSTGKKQRETRHITAISQQHTTRCTRNSSAALFYNYLPQPIQDSGLGQRWAVT